MAKSFLLAVTQGGTAFADNTTRYTPITGQKTNATGFGVSSRRFHTAGILKNLSTYASSNTTLVDSTVTLQVESVDTSILVTYSSGQTGIKEDTSNTYTVADTTDRYEYKITVANDISGATTITLHLFKLEFQPENVAITHTLLGTSSLVNATTASSNSYYIPMGGTVAENNTEANQKYRIRTNIITSNFHADTGTSTRTTDTVVRTRVNGINGNQSVTYSAGQSGDKEDTTNTDTLVVGDDYNYHLSLGTGSGTIQIIGPGTEGVTTNGYFCLLNGRTTGTSHNFNTTTYHAISGNHASAAPSEAAIQTYPRFTFRASELGTLVITNTIATSPSTITVRDNGADSTLVVSYDAAQTGLKHDSTNSVMITSGTDEINYKVVTPNTSGAMSVTWMSILGQVPNSNFLMFMGPQPQG